MPKKLEDARKKAQLKSMMDLFLKNAAKTPITDEFKLSEQELKEYKNSPGLSFDDAFNQVIACYDYHHYLSLAFSQSSQYSNCPEPNLYAMLRLMSELGFTFRSTDPQVDHDYEGNMTPLVFAASQGDLKSCKYLVSEGSDVNQLVIQPGKPLTAPIIEALKSGSQELCRFLLLQGASLRNELGCFYPDYQSLVAELLPEEVVLFDKVQLIDEQINEARKSYSTFIALIDAQVHELERLSVADIPASDAFLILSRALNNDRTFNNDEIFPPTGRMMDQNNWIDVVQSLKEWLQDPSVQVLYWWNPSHSTLQIIAEHAADGLLTRADLQAFQQAGGNFDASLHRGGPVLCYVAERSRLTQTPLARILGLLISAGVPSNDCNRAGKTPLMIVKDSEKGSEYLKRFLQKQAPVAEPLILSRKRSHSQERSEASEFKQPLKKRAFRRSNTANL